MTTARSNSTQCIRLEDDYGAHNYQPLDVVIQRGEGVWVWDVDGNKYLDFLAAYSAVNQGHAHPRIRKVLVEQSERVTLTSRAFRSDQLGLLYKEMHELSGYRRMLPMNTGAEAVETAIKAARKWGYQVKGVERNKAEVIVCANNFHGRTIAVVGFSTDPTARADFGPFAPGFKVVPFGNAEALEAAITDRTRLLIHCSPSNPTGSVYPRDELEAMAGVLAGRYRLVGATATFQQTRAGLAILSTVKRRWPDAVGHVDHL